MSALLPYVSNAIVLYIDKIKELFSEANTVLTLTQIYKTVYFALLTYWMPTYEITCKFKISFSSQHVNIYAKDLLKSFSIYCACWLCTIIFWLLSGSKK